MSKRYRPVCGNLIHQDMTREEIRNEFVWLKRNGYGGIITRSSTRDPNLSTEDWFPGYLNSIRLCCETAREMNMDIWIFDELGYPSGIAGGLVLTPENRTKKLKKVIDITLEKGESICLPVPERTISAGALPINMFGPYHPIGAAEMVDFSSGKICYTASQRTRLVAVAWEPYTFLCHGIMGQASWEQNPAYGTTDILDKDCVRKFLNQMHERYVPVVGDEFGKTIKGFFYDEPEVSWELPYTFELHERFQQRHGYDLCTVLPEIAAYMIPEDGTTGCEESKTRLKKIFDDYTDSWTSLLEDNFYGQLESWCHDHGLMSVGHQDLDHHSETLVTVSGDFFRNSRRSDMPGIDVVFDNIHPDKFVDYPRFAGSIKRALHKSGAISETFAAMGPSMPPDIMRYVMEHQIFRGIDEFCLLTEHTIDPPSRDPNVGLYTRALMNRAEETTSVLAQGKERSKIALLIPLSYIAFSRMHHNPHMTNDIMPWERLDMVAEALCYAPLDFDYVWEEGLSNLRERGFEYLIVTGNPVKEEAAREIQRFQEQGGKVWSVIRPFRQVKGIPYQTRIRRLLELLPKDVTLKAPEKAVSMTSRQLEDGVLYAFLNESDGKFDAELHFEEKDICCLDIQSGLWYEWNGRCEFLPREAKFFRTGIKGLPAEKVTSSMTLTDWTLNGKKLRRLCSWTEAGLENYTGFGEYETEFDWEGGDVRVCLGEVGFAAKVTLNDQVFDLPFSPWSFRTNLPEGHYKMQIRVLNSFASQCQAEHNLWAYEQPYLRCGLLENPVLEHIAAE